MDKRKNIDKSIIKFVAISGTILIGTIIEVWVLGGWAMGVVGCCLAIMSAGVTFLVTRLWRSICKEEGGGRSQRPPLKRKGGGRSQRVGVNRKETPAPKTQRKGGVKTQMTESCGRCYWYDEDKDMGATIPYCRLFDLYGDRAFERHFEDGTECDEYITVKAADEIIRSRRLG